MAEPDGCKSCKSRDLYHGQRLCRTCYNEGERMRRAAARTDPSVRARERERERQRFRDRYQTDPEFRKRKIEANSKRRLFYQREGDLTSAHWDVLTAYYQGLCAYCLAPATVLDHVDALARGGGHTATNVVPACDACNSAKGDRLLIEWGGR
ncbi:HNH endonuclease [Acrocarpospora sp. B8E8]|uniref:HNH endonuclease n=1 Tax=Acrocarpospora sp. B8E8 TaxID=3153572 RepID=UPI00325D833B